MAKVYFRYGAMGASKSANALMVAHNYKEQGRQVILMKPATDTRWAHGEITSRAGNMHQKCVLIPANEKISALIPEMLLLAGLEAIIIDEAQFLSAKQVEELAMIADNYDVTVICYGLKNTSIKGKLFEGSEALLYWADSIEEIKTLCKCCHKKATQNLRLVGGKPTYGGEVVCIGDTVDSSDAKEVYVPVCRKHYFNPEL